MKQKQPSDIDLHIAGRLRLARMAARLSATAVGTALGVTFQQVQKYENGKNRISAGRLAEIAGILKRPVSYFYQGIHPEED